MTLTVELPRLDAEAADQDLVARARSLFPQLRERAASVEEARRISESTITELQSAGLFKLFVPRRFGGHQTSVRTFLDVSAEVARGCGSTGWVTALINICGWLGSLYSEQAQQEVWGADPDARIAGVLTPSATATAADGGLVLNGKWSFASGCLHSSWAVLGHPIVDANGTMIDQGLTLVPMRDLRIEDTWYTAGMRGTGSNTLVGTDLFVPNHRIFSVPRAIEGDYATPYKDEPLYRAAFIPLLSLILIGPQLGMARAALETVLQQVPKRGIAYTMYTKQAEAPTTHLQLALAAEKIDTAHLHAYRAAADIEQAAQRGVYLDRLTRARVRMDTGYVARQCREAIEILLSVNGAGSFADANPLQRMWRDTETASRHAVIGPEISQELYGRELLGLETNITPLI
ncbi:MAG: acyl-CoA dehydrogenase family protein [Chloroflexi bacterium]|nr:acyl-CoA dehydrogenase family protein [Chloroflexota bacterium]